jgi:hypothetical protein
MSSLHSQWNLFTKSSECKFVLFGWCSSSWCWIRRSHCDEQDECKWKGTTANVIHSQVKSVKGNTWQHEQQMFSGWLWYLILAVLLWLRFPCFSLCILVLRTVQWNEMMTLKVVSVTQVLFSAASLSIELWESVLADIVVVSLRAWQTAMIKSVERESCSDEQNQTWEMVEFTFVDVGLEYFWRTVFCQEIKKESEGVNCRVSDIFRHKRQPWLFYGIELYLFRESSTLKDEKGICAGFLVWLSILTLLFSDVMNCHGYLNSKTVTILLGSNG